MHGNFRPDVLSLLMDAFNVSPVRSNLKRPERCDLHAQVNTHSTNEIICMGYYNDTVGRTKHLGGYGESHHEVSVHFQIRFLHNRV